MTIDLLLILALYFGLAEILALPYIQMPLWILGAVFLFILAFDSIKNADKDITLAGEQVNKSLVKTFRNGLLVAISPGNLVFWVSVFGAVLADSYSQSNSSSFIVAALGILTGILLHDIGLLSIVSLTRKIMNRTMIKWTSILAGLLLFGFACYFLFEFYVDIQSYI